MKKRRRGRGRHLPIIGIVLVVVGVSKCRERRAHRERIEHPVTTSSPRPSVDDVEVAAGDDGPVEIVLDPVAAGVDPAAASSRRNVYLVFDGSGSMRARPTADCGGDRDFDSNLAGAQWALDSVLEKTPDDFNLGLYVFDDRGEREVVPLDGSRADLAAAIDDFRSGGRTPLAPAIRFATDRLVEQYQRQGGYGDYRLVVITDGKATGLPDAVRYASRHGMPIHAIGLCLRESHELRDLATTYRDAASFKELAQAFEASLAPPASAEPTEFPGADSGTPRR